MNIHYFTFNPFQENTYVLYDDTHECIIVDPGCYEPHEEKALKRFIEENGLKPQKLVLTHFHLDHIMGNYFVAKRWGIDLMGHRKGLPTLKMDKTSASMYGFNAYQPSPEPAEFIEHGAIFSFGSTELEVRFVPGHSPGHIALIHHESKSVIGGDVLFQGSIGRTDLPGGDYATLEQSIKEQLYTLPDDYRVYPGHGPATTIGNEKQFNAFVRG